MDDVGAPAPTGGGKNQMRTWTGRHVDPLDPHTEDISIADIAHALALQCRYNGHSVGHLSVARHSLWVSSVIELHHPYDWTLQLTGLLHDASEAYLGDMIRPLKHRPEMAFFAEVESRMERRIAEAFDLIWPWPEEIGKADYLVLTEYEGVGQALVDLPWSHDENAFRDRYDFLVKQRGEA